MEKQSKKIAILILNWNGVKLLETYLPNVIKYNSSEAEIIIVDNASNDNSILFLQNTYPNLKRIEFKDNYGFAKGYNKAMKLITHKYVVLLNSDVRVTENWLQAPIEFLNSKTDYAACQPKILDDKIPLKFEYAGASGGYIDTLGYPFCRGRIFKSLEYDNGQHDQIKDIFWASGAALFIRREVYIKTGGLDESFFAHQEEIDLCWRILNEGHKIACIPQSIVYHLGGASLDKSRPKKTFLNFRNNLIMLLKNLPSYALPIIFIRLILDGLAGVKFITEGKIIHSFAILKAHISFYLKIPSTIKKRRKTAAISTEIKYKGSVLIDYYLKGNKRFNDLNW